MKFENMCDAYEIVFIEIIAPFEPIELNWHVLQN